MQPPHRALYIKDTRRIPERPSSAPSLQYSTLHTPLPQPHPTFPAPWLFPPPSLPPPVVAFSSPRPSVQHLSLTHTHTHTPTHTHTLNSDAHFPLFPLLSFTHTLLATHPLTELHSLPFPHRRTHILRPIPLHYLVPQCRSRGSICEQRKDLQHGGRVCWWRACVSYALAVFDHVGSMSH